MPLAIPPELKKITQFVRRAEELDRDTGQAESRLVAYFARQHAVHLGIPLANSPESKAALQALLESLEKEKEAMSTFTRDEAAFLCRTFATKVFDKADAEDRSGANKATARTFYAAASFWQMLEQFEDEASEQAQEDRKKALYCKWKATDILNAIKEGRQPTPGGFNEEESMGVDIEGDTKAATEAQAPIVETVEEDVAPAPSPGALEPLPPPPAPIEPEPEVDNGGQEVELGPPPAYPGGNDDDTVYSLPAAPVVTPKPASPPKKKGIFGGFAKQPKSPQNSKKVTKSMMADASELANFAIKALEDKDADLAAKRLQDALRALGR